ncbi:hypothetical protein L227DRAFT_127143 [Lentinus tigrinus ALCF2SS1-6]|uniref:Uncharacterized protein n=1 Tax=Lentinus tigrinus ALCF2SS1-6 TaxID=1328759 RepID=A0A5C2SRD9_9APHY|nr:hypothetical protein L227DRAFT_127143 [Lentinus tigrinus ALCF2SS1-6]
MRERPLRPLRTKHPPSSHPHVPVPICGSIPFWTPGRLITRTASVPSLPTDRRRVRGRRLRLYGSSITAPSLPQRPRWSPQLTTCVLTEALSWGVPCTTHIRVLSIARARSWPSQASHILEASSIEARLQRQSAASARGPSGRRLLPRACTRTRGKSKVPVGLAVKERMLLCQRACPVVQRAVGTALTDVFKAATKRPSGSVCNLRRTTRDYTMVHEGLLQ